MTILENSPLQNNNRRMPLNSGIEPKLYFTDTATELYFIVVKNISGDTYTVTYNGKLKGYNNNYRFDFSKYIDIIQHIEPVFENITDNYNQKFVNNNFTNLSFICYAYNIFTSYPSKFTTLSNGEVRFNGDPLDFISEENVNGVVYTFFNKEDITSTNVGLPNQIFKETFIPSTMSPTFDDITGDWIGKNLIINSQHPVWEHNVSLDQMTSVVRTDEFELYVRNTPISGQFISMFSAGLGITVFDDPDCTYYASMDVRIVGGGFGNSDVNMYIHTDVADSEKVTYNLQNYLWNRITTNGFKLPLVNSPSSEGYIILQNISSNRNDIIVDVKNVKIEKNYITNYTPSVIDYSLSVICYDQNNNVTNKLNVNNDGNTTDYLTYIPEQTTKIYCHSNNKQGFFNVNPLKCNLHTWYYYNNNGNLQLSYTDANVHEIENTQKEYLTIGNKEYTTKVITTKQKKINTGYGLGEQEMYELVKTPYVYQSTSPNLIELEPNGYNFYKKSMLLYGVSEQGAIVSHNDYEWVLVGAQNDPVVVFRIPNVINSTGWWTISFDFRGTQGMYINGTIDVCDSFAGTFTSNNRDEFERVSFPINVTYYSPELYDFIDINCPQWAYYNIKNIKVERGQVATPYTKNPFDTDSTFGLQTFKRFKQLNSTFEGFNGSNLSEKNIEMIIEDEKKYEKKSNIKLNFFD